MLDDPQVLKPFDRREAIAISLAAKLAGVSSQAVRDWCRQHSIGRKIGGQWRVSRAALQMFLNGDQQALRDYLKGQRGGRVAAYLASSMIAQKNKEPKVPD